MTPVQTQHLLLSFFWILYCIVHSVLANGSVKNKVQNIMQDNYKYYRPAYAIFATFTLIAVIWFHFSITSLEIYTPSFIIKLIGYLITLTGLIIMLICIKKYFYELSGLQALQHEKATNTLQTNGLHSFVRHPLYFGTIAFVVGLTIAFSYLNNIIATLIITIYVWIGINVEEKKLVQEYGDQYIKYKQRVPKLIPFAK
ncbi:MAG: isoprenylcysteine carboxylmethyltransferase family protein [Ginsengibacter sp.]